MVSKTKKDLVQKLIEQITESPIVGVVNFQHLPAQQLQNMRATLLKRGVIMLMARKKLLFRALGEAKKDHITDLQEKLKGMPALLFTKENPFALYSTIQKNKSSAPAKGGQIAPNDIVVSAGATNFLPGPIISELAAVGIKTKVEGGKLAIVEDTIVAKEGDEISAELAAMLARLDIQPMEVGLDLVAVWENGTIYDAKQLHVDDAEYEANFIQAAQWAMNLAMEAAIPIPETTELLLQKAFNDAKGLALEADILTDLTAGLIVEKAERQAKALEGSLPDVKVEAAVEAPKAEEEPVKEEASKVEEAKPEEPKVEEKVEEPDPKVEEAKEETPVEEPAPELVKEEETPAQPEEKAEEPKVEESPTEEAKPEEPETPSEETPAEQAPEEAPVEEPAPEAKEAPVQESQVEEAPEEPVPETAEPEAIPVTDRDLSPDGAKGETTPSSIIEEKETPAEATPVQTETTEEEKVVEATPVIEEKEAVIEEPKVEEVPESVEKAPESKQESEEPSAESIIQAMKEKFGETQSKAEVSAESLVQEEKQKAQEEKGQEPDKSVEDTEQLFKELMKKGTLRD